MFKVDRSRLKLLMRERDYLDQSDQEKIRRFSNGSHCLVNLRIDHKHDLKSDHNNTNPDG